MKTIDHHDALSAGASAVGPTPQQIDAVCGMHVEPNTPYRTILAGNGTVKLTALWFDSAEIGGAYVNAGPLHAELSGIIS